MIGTLLVAIVATQWPFDYDVTRYAIARRWDRVSWSWWPRTPRGELRIDRDFVQNLVMLAPLGVGLGLWRRARSLRVVGESIAIATLASGTFEAAQLLTRNRYTSVPDLWTNVVGCTIACACVVVARRWRRKRRERDLSFR